MACYFTCPKCRLPLYEADKTWKCGNGHSYDISKTGYVNLLPPSGKSGHGDDKAMVTARRAFLEAGYYGNLAGAVCDAAVRLTPDGGSIFDAGCGEGYYTHRVFDAMISAGRSFRIAAADISKNALSAAAHHAPDISWAAASVYALPLSDCGTDLVINIFSPLALPEYHRILKPGGYFLYVIPLEEHLYSLKQLIYDTPYLNEVRDTHLDGFTLAERTDVRSEITLSCGDDVQNLFTMTPYFHKTGDADRKKLDTVTSLVTEAAFGVLIYRKV